MKEGHTNKKDINKKILILITIIGILIVSNIFFIIAYLNNNVSSHSNKTSSLKNENGQFSLLANNIVEMDIDEFKELQEQTIINYYPLKTKINNYLSLSMVNQRLGIYFEDLNTGSWIGINEKDKFDVGSLFKIPTAVAVMKKIETTNMSLNDEITITKELLSYKYGELGYLGEGKQFKISELIDISLKNSDNTADNALRSTLASGEFADAVLGLGIPYNIRSDMTGNYVKISSKDYSNIFRSLYYSSYLKRPFSNELLDTLSKTKFTDGLKAGVPEDIVVSHKIAAFELVHHDCGIVYAENKPYIICIMTENVTQAKANQVFRDVNKMVYDFVVNEK